MVGLKDKNEFSEKKTNEGVVKISDEKEIVEKEQKNEVLAKEEEQEISKVEPIQSIALWSHWLQQHTHG